MTGNAGVPILMYHSVSDDGPGPVSIGTATFREQVAVLSDAGAQGISASEYVAAGHAARVHPPNTVVLTFDDGYRDFVDAVFPHIQAAGWRCTVFLPVRPIDADRLWDCGDGWPRELMTWRTIEELSAAGVEFGAHSMTHSDLTRLTPEEARLELVDSARRIGEQAGCRVQGFAPPFGRTSPALREELKRHYAWAVGTRMSRACERSDVFDLPRVEMWYFRDVRRWRHYVSRGWTPYFALRRALRAIRETV